MSINQSIKPITTETKGNIYVGGCDLVELAYKYGTPLYVVDEATLRGICREYKSAFSAYKNVKMMYASKALCNLAIARILADEGFGFDLDTRRRWLYTAITRAKKEILIVSK